MSRGSVTVSGAVRGGSAEIAPQARRGMAAAGAVRGREPAVGVGAPSLTWEFVGSDLGFQNNSEGIKFRGIGRSGDRLYLIPYGADYVAELDLQDDSTITGPSVAHIPTGTGANQYRKWIEAHTAADGRIFANANHAWGHLIIDPSTVPSTVDTVKIASGAELETALQCRSGAIIGDTLFSMTWNSNVVRVVNTVTGRYEQNFPIPLDRTGPIYEAFPTWEGQPTGTFERFWGVTAGANGKAHVTPWSSDRIGIIDGSARTAEHGVDPLTGLGDFPPASVNIMTDPFFVKYCGGAFSPINECIYHFPRHAKGVLKSDTNTGRAVEIPLPAGMLAAKIVDKTWSFSTFAGPNGLICSVPWNMPYFFWLDPRTDEIGYVDISDLLLAGTGAPSLFFTYGITVGNAAYLSPAYSRYVGKISFAWP